MQTTLKSRNGEEIQKRRQKSAALVLSSPAVISKRYGAEAERLGNARTAKFQNTEHQLYRWRCREEKASLF